MSEKQPKHYINNKDFLNALVEYKQACKFAKENKKTEPQIPNYIGECFLKIAEHLSRKPNFISYSFRDEMIADGMANAATFNTNNTVSIYDNVQPGRTVQIWYTTTANTLDNNTDDFADVTGLPQSCQDVVTLGAAYKLLSFLDPGRINLSSAEADAADSKIPSTAGVSSSRYIYALYQQRLNEEALKLKDKYPIRIHYTR